MAASAPALVDELAGSPDVHDEITTPDDLLGDRPSPRRARAAMFELPTLSSSGVARARCAADQSRSGAQCKELFVRYLDAITPHLLPDEEAALVTTCAKDDPPGYWMSSRSTPSAS